MAAPVVRVMGEGEGLPGPAQKCWRRLRRRLEVLRGVERLVKGLRLPLGLSFDALLLLALLLWAEIRLHPAPILRWTLAACAAVLLLLQLRRRLRAAWRGISSLLDSAQRLDRERRHHDRLTAAVSLAGESRDVLAQFSPPLLLQLYREAERDARRLWLLSLSAWRAAFFELAGIAALVAAAWYLPYYTPYTFPDLWGRYTARLISPHAPAPVQLAVSPGHLSFRKGEPVEIAAAVVGEIAAPPVLVFRSLSVDWERLLMRETDSKGRYGRTLSGLTSRFEYFVEASRLKSPVYQGTPIETVALRNLRIETLPPPYASSLPQPVEADAGEIALTEGGRIAWTVELEEPARRVVWQYLVEAGPGPAAERADLRAATYLAPVWGWPVVGSKVWKADMAPPQSCFCELIAEASRPGVEPFVRRWKIALTPDQPPRVEITFPAADTSYPEREPLVLRYGIRDDHGINRVELRYRVGKSRETSETLHQLGPGQRELVGTYVWSSLPYPPPREPIYYYLWADDRAPAVAGEPHAGSSPVYVVGEIPREASEAFERTAGTARELLQLAEEARGLSERLGSPEGKLPSPREAAELERKLAEARRARQEGRGPAVPDGRTGAGQAEAAERQAGEAREALEDGDLSRARAAARRLAETTDRMAREAARQEGLDATERRRPGASIADLLEEIRSEQPPSQIGAPAPAGRGTTPVGAARTVAERESTAPGARRGDAPPSTAGSAGPADNRPTASISGGAPYSNRPLPEAGSHTFTRRPGSPAARDRTFEPERFPDKYKDAVNRYRRILRERSG